MKKFIDKCRNMDGPLSNDVKELLLAVILDPTLETWEAAHGLIIQVEPTHLTLWQAWRAIDPKAPRVGRSIDFEGNVLREWESTPSSFTLLRALQYATV